jgi:GNAT superfamily N-acetyltransferase
MIKILGIRENPELLEMGTKFFHGAFGNKDNYMLYLDCITHSITTESTLPRWFLAMKGDAIVGGCGLITNDFISRMDLWPWLAALYVVESERGRGLGGKLLAHGVGEAGKLGFPKVYLTTDHDSYYERYGWQHIGTGYAPWADSGRIYEIETENK